MTIPGGSIAVTELDAGSNAVALTAVTGSVTDGGDVGIDITGGATTLNAPNGTIGASGDAISLDVTSLVTNTAAGGGDQFVTTAGTLDLNTSSSAGGTVDHDGERSKSQRVRRSRAIETFTGNVDINSGATLGGIGTVTGDVNVARGATLAPGNSPGIINTGNLNIDGNLLVDIADDQAAGTSEGYDQTNVTGTVTLGATSTLTFDFTGLTPAELNIGRRSRSSPMTLPTRSRERSAGLAKVRLSPAILPVPGLDSRSATSAETATMLCSASKGKSRRLARWPLRREPARPRKRFLPTQSIPEMTPCWSSPRRATRQSRESRLAARL